MRQLRKSEKRRLGCGLAGRRSKGLTSGNARLKRRPKRNDHPKACQESIRNLPTKAATPPDYFIDQEISIPAPEVTAELADATIIVAREVTKDPMFKARALKEFRSGPRSGPHQQPKSDKNMPHIQGLKGVGFHHGRVYLESSSRTMERHRDGNRDHTTEPPNMRKILSNHTLSAENQVAQLVFLYTGSLQLHILPTPTRTFCPHQGLFECGSDGEHNDTCYTFLSVMSRYARQLRQGIIDVTYDWVSISLALQPGTIPPRRQDRVDLWRELLSPADIKFLFRILEPGVDLTKFTDSESWVSWATNILATLADDIFLFYYVSKGNESFVGVLLQRQMEESMDQTSRMRTCPIGRELYVL